MRTFIGPLDIVKLRWVGSALSKACSGVGVCVHTRCIGQSYHSSPFSQWFASPFFKRCLSYFGFCRRHNCVLSYLTELSSQVTELFFRRNYALVTTIYNTKSPHLHHNHDIQNLIPTFISYIYKSINIGLCIFPPTPLGDDIILSCRPSRR